MICWGQNQERKHSSLVIKNEYKELRGESKRWIGKVICEQIIVNYKYIIGGLSALDIA